MNRHKRYILTTVILLVLILLSYWQLPKNSFISIDDTEYVLKNKHVLAGIRLDGIRWSFTTFYMSNWHPLTWLSHMVDVEIYGLKSWGHHFTNLVLHTTNSILLFYVLNAMTTSLWANFFIASLFAVHPLHVQSVAWIAERKDVLSSLFWMATLASYLLYVRNKSKWKYMMIVLFISLGLLSKPMVITLPIILLIMDYWPLGRAGVNSQMPNSKKRSNVIAWCERYKPLIVEKTPLIGLSIISAVITFFAQKSGGAVVPMGIVHFPMRVVNVLSGYAWYIGKMFWPIKLSIFYPYPRSAPPLINIISLMVLIMGISAVALMMSRRWPYVTLGWFWYLVVLSPVIGLIQIGGQSTADRYSYLPIIGLFITIMWSFDELISKGWAKGKNIIYLGGVVLVILTILTRKNVTYWRDSVTLLTRAIQVTENNAVAQNALGAALISEHRYKEGIGAYQEAIKIDPDFVEAYNNLGVALGMQNRYREAIDNFKQAIRRKNNYVDALFNLGLAYISLNLQAEASEVFNLSIRIKPDDAEAHYQLALTYIRLGQDREFSEEHKILARLDKDLAARLLQDSSQWLR